MEGFTRPSTGASSMAGFEITSMGKRDQDSVGHLGGGDILEDPCPGW